MKKYNNNISLSIRKFHIDKNVKMGRHWFHGSPLITHLLNTFTILVPGNERFYMRTLRRCLPLVSDSDLKQYILDFCRQEGMHGLGHEAYWPMLEQQGYRFSWFVRVTDFFSYKIAEFLLPLKFCMAIVVAIEHINAYLAHIHLSSDLLADAEDEPRRLFEWHFAEEIEHKGVAMDVYTAIGGGYILRSVMMLVVAFQFYLYEFIGSIIFMLQDRRWFMPSAWYTGFIFLFIKEKTFWKSMGFLVQYFSLSFQPWNLSDYGLAKAVFLQYGFEQAMPKSD